VFSSASICAAVGTTLVEQIAEIGRQLLEADWAP
jgi:hypothetical protein